MGQLNAKKLQHLHEVLEAQCMKIKNKKMRIEKDEVKERRTKNL